MIPQGALDDELIFSFVRSSGPGGQHVNKVSTKVRLRFSVADSKVFNEEQKERLFIKLKSRLTNDGSMILEYDASRSQARNKREVQKVLYSLLNCALKKAKPRKASTPSAASKSKRKVAKQRNAEIKALRKKPEIP